MLPEGLTTKFPASSKSPPTTAERFATVTPVIAPLSSIVPSLLIIARFPAVRPSPVLVTTPYKKPSAGLRPIAPIVPAVALVPIAYLVAGLFDGSCLNSWRSA